MVAGGVRLLLRPVRRRFSIGIARILPLSRRRMLLENCQQFTSAPRRSRSPVMAILRFRSASRDLDGKSFDFVIVLVAKGSTVSSSRRSDNGVGVGG